jgi:hypothetical protein
MAGTPPQSKGGFGQVGFGRCNYGQGSSEYEARFSDSDPVDGSVGVSVFQFTISFTLYCFASRIQWGADSGLLVEVSEDGGGSYNPAYENGAFVAPFNGSDSRVEPQTVDGQLFTMFLHKTSPWLDDKEIKVRVTAQDEYGDEATKEVPVEW